MKAILFPATAILSALCVCTPVLAQETHTIAPKFPDAFKARTTIISDTEQVIKDQHKKSHALVTMLADTRKTDTGYHATVSIENLDATEPAADPAAAPLPMPGASMQMAMQQRVLQVFKMIGSAEVTLDSEMTPVRVGNLEQIKTNLLNLATADSKPEEKDKAKQIFDLMLGDMTPESAASLLRQAKQAGVAYNRPLTMNQPVAMNSENFQFLGATLKMDGQMTLTNWQEGKTARVHYTTAPTDADLQLFVTTLAENLLTRITPLLDEKTKTSMAQVRPMLVRVISGMQMHTETICDMDIDLTSTIVTHNDCNGTVDITMDMRKVLTETQLKANPEAAAKMEPIKIVQTSHTVSDTTLVP
jgi:hypothetical protein